MNEKNIDVSLIIPVFNAERYLDDCLASIDQQLFDGVIEVILVNDGSVDASDSLCLKHKASRSNCVTYIKHEQNKGVSAARNSGLDVAKGKYVFFFDADDIIPACAIRNLYKAAEEYQADIVKGNIQKFNAKNEKPMGYVAINNSIYKEDDVLATLLRHEKIRGHSWGKLFLRRDNTKFPLGVAMAEDLLFCVEYFMQAKKLVIIPEDVYKYREHTDSVTDNKYYSGVYKHWFDSVSAIDAYSLNKKQRNAYKILKVRTLFQAVNEVRRGDESVRNEVMKDLMLSKKAWNISTINCFLIFISNPKTLFRYVKFKVIASRMQ